MHAVVLASRLQPEDALDMAHGYLVGRHPGSALDRLGRKIRVLANHGILPVYTATIAHGRRTRR